MTRKTKKTRTEEAIIRILNNNERSWTPRIESPFKTLIRTILSQNTNWRNEETAYRRLEEAIGVKPRKLAEAQIETIADAIKPAGMYNIRSETIKKVSMQVLNRFGGDLESTVTKPYIIAREELMSLPGVGEKTADVVLLFNTRKNVIPIDRHIARIAKRLEFVSIHAPYDEIRHKLERATIPESYLDTHIKLIQFGRDTCRAQKPLCPICILKDICPYPLKEEEHPKKINKPKTQPQTQKPTK